MHFRCVITMLICCVVVGLDWAEPMRYLSLHVTCSCIFHEYVPLILNILIYLMLFGAFLHLSLSLSLLLALVCSMAPKRKSTLPRTLFVLGHPLLLLTLLFLTYGFMMIKLGRTFQRTFLDEAFIRNAKSFYRTFPILTFPLSSIVGVGSYCVASQSLVPPYLILSLTFKVHSS